MVGVAAAITTLVVVVMVMMIVMTGVSTGFIHAGLVYSRPLGYAVIVAFPDNVCIWRECQKPFNGFPEKKIKKKKSATCSSYKYCSCIILMAYLILILRPPSIFVHMLKTSSPLLTLRTAPQTSSLASANWSPIMARSRSSQYLSATPFFNLMIHFPPFLFASSSHTGRIFFLNM